MCFRLQEFDFLAGIGNDTRVFPKIHVAQKIKLTLPNRNDWLAFRHAPMNGDDLLHFALSVIPHESALRIANVQANTVARDESEVWDASSLFSNGPK